MKYAKFNIAYVEKNAGAWFVRLSICMFILFLYNNLIVNFPNLQ